MSMPTLHQIALSAVLGSALAACAVSQQDTPSDPATAQLAPDAPSAPLAQAQPRQHMQLRVVPRQAAQPQQIPMQIQSQPQFQMRNGPALRLRRADGPMLGVMVSETPDGLQITSIDDGSLAQSAGLKEKDILLRIGDEHLHDIADIQSALRAYKPGDSVKLGVIRAGEGIVELSGTLPEPKPAPEPPAVPAPPTADGFKGGFLGVQMAGPDEDKDAAGNGGPGVKVAGVVPDSAAWFAGLQEGDRLLAVDGKTLASGEDLVGAVSGKEPGSLVELRFTRDGAEQTVKVRLGHRAVNGALSGMFDQSPLPGMRLHRLDPNDMQGFDPGQFGPDLFHFMHDGQGDMFKGLDLDNPGPGSQSVRIDMRDGQGTMTVTRDGKTETYTMDGSGNWVPQNNATPDDKSSDQSPRARNS